MIGSTAALSQGIVKTSVAEPEEVRASSSPRCYYGWIMLPLAMGALIASSPG
jgi:hypothetical protein